MIKKSILFFVLIFFVLGAAFAQRGGRAADVLEVRLGSPLPRNSDWGRTLDRIAAEWARVTNGEVRLRVIHDGLEGSDARMLASLNANNIQAALFASTALSEIIPPIITLSVPFLIRDDEEYDVVLREVLPVLNEQMNRTNFVAVAWSKGGWVHMFTREPVFTPDDLRRQRIGSSPEIRELNTAFRTMGFNIVETDMVDIGTRLANNMINAVYFLPEAVAPLGLHRTLRNYLDLPIAPFIGAIVVNRVTWNRISPEHQQAIIRVTQNIATEFDTTMARTSANALAAMQRDGLAVNRPSPEQMELWHDDISRAMPLLLDAATFDRDMFNRVNQILETHRNSR